jgi:AraC-like DNA-binding protein
MTQPHNFKYLTHNAENVSWGMFLTVAGSADVEPDTDYPPAGHPNGYHFNWQNGRVLQEYQINYITRGEGVMETSEGSFPIKEGSLILIRPNVWHRYKPLRRTGWTEHYVGFMGTSADRMFNASPILSDTPVIHLGYHENLLHCFQEICNLVQSERPGFHNICSGLVTQILGHMIALKKSENFRHSQMEQVIQKACMIIREHLAQNLNVEQLASDLDANYSVFRKAFKRYTGLSPMQYHTNLRLKQAMYLLTNTDLSIKEISFNLGFCSVFYFSKLFKEKLLITPSTIRKSNRVI